MNKLIYTLAFAFFLSSTCMAQVMPPFWLSDEPLNQAIQKGKINEVKRLIAAGADVNKFDSFDEAPLHAAARVGDREIINVLVSHSANINARNKDGRTPLHQAVSVWYSFEPPSKRAAVIEALVQHGGDINAIDSYERSPLHFAVFGTVKDSLVVEKLLDLGANINATDKSGRTPLHYVVQQRPEEAQGQPNPLPVAKLLIKHGANINNRTTDGKTPLHSAALRDNATMVELLLSNGADQNAIHPASGRTPREMTQDPNVLKKFDKYKQQ